MSRPDLSIVTQQLKAQRDRIFAAFAGLTDAQQRSERASYEQAKSAGEAVFHPFHLCLA
ncbi:MAG: hypothetical protein ACT6R7_16475 [Brevundimonas aurantiaca]|jgi:hypothetical protein|uniref:hypothetical protein n=1 Tax=Brevundimonas aurantiaca TaxID=74316 RepID=UPI0040346B9A